MSEDPLEAYESWLERFIDKILERAYQKSMGEKPVTEETIRDLTETSTGRLGAFNEAITYWTKLSARKGRTNLERYITSMERLSRKNGDPTFRERIRKKGAYRLIILKAKRIQ